MMSATRVLQAADHGRLELESIVGVLSARFTVATGSKHVVRRRRLDTFDRRLHAAGFTLEHQIVAPGERLVLGRLDGSLTVAVPVQNLRWPALADALPSGPVGDAIAPVVGIRALVVASDERRRMRQLELCNEDGKTVARVELDEPASVSSVAASPAQLTVRTLRGYDEQARRACSLLVGLGLRAAERGGERESRSASKSSGTDRAVPARVLLTAGLRDSLAAMRENLPGLLDDVDTEFLHDFRVAVRRTRATLKLGRPALPDAMRSRWELAFKRLGDLTTPVRDLDVYVLDLPTMSHWLVTADPRDLDPLAAHLRALRAAARRPLVASLRSARFGQLVADWEQELNRLAELPQDGEHVSAGEWADASILRAYRRVVRGGAAIRADSPAEDLHELRKRCKELRYALEVCSPVVARGPRKRAIADLKELQDVLGRFQDCDVQRHALRGFAEEMMTEGTSAAAVLAMGELIGHLDVDQVRARREFDGAFARFAGPSSQRLMHTFGGGR